MARNEQALGGLVARIDAELDRLDSLDTGNGGCCCAAEDNLPFGWVRVYDGTADAWGPAAEILAALEAVEYDPKQIVRTEDQGEPCYDVACPHWHGTEPEAGATHDHGHSKLVQITALEDNRGFEAAWGALASFDTEPTSSRAWPTELIDTEALEDGTPNDNPNTLFVLATNAGIRYAAGPTGANYCGLSDWLANDSDWATSREQAIEEGCAFEESEES